MTDTSKSLQMDSEKNVDLEKSVSRHNSRKHIQSRYNELIDSLPIIIYIVEPHPPYTPIYVSKGIEMLGYSQEEWHSQPDLWISIIHEDDREWVLHETGDAIRNGCETDFEYRMCARDGGVHWFYDKGRFVRDENGEPISWEGFLLDITKRKSGEKKLTSVESQSDSFDGQAGEKILLVEDEEIVREMIRQILLAENYRVTTAANGLEALKIFESGENFFDLLITDINMPQMNGRELAERITALTGIESILYISGYADDDDFRRDITDSEKHFMAKPFSPENLIYKVKEILGGK